MYFNQWVTSIAEAGKEILTSNKWSNVFSKKNDITTLCKELNSSKGEALGIALAHEVVHCYIQLTDEQQKGFFFDLLEEFNPDADQIAEKAQQYKENGDLASYKALIESVESPRQQLFKRINMAPQGTAVLVTMREHLLGQIKEHPKLEVVDIDLYQLMVSWFNRGFLHIEQISWKTPAHILEKLISYEAVHEMNGWDDLRRRLADDRRCFAFFHPSLEDEPLIFVEVALVQGMAGNVQELLAESDHENNEKLPPPDTAIFYSISNCQNGLQGISFGNFLIKQVVRELTKENIQLKQFATLSPIPGFMKWLQKQRQDPKSTLLDASQRETLNLLEGQDWHKDTETITTLQPLVTKLCATYLCNAKKGQKPLDPVARFHLGNGAQIERLNWLGDRSPRGIKQSAGMLVNYGYELKKVEANHEGFVNAGKVFTSSMVQKALK